jgi:hypothetical protein
MTSVLIVSARAPDGDREPITVTTARKKRRNLRGRVDGFTKSTPSQIVFL